ncbi:ion channel [Alkanindiges illinoisensis]|uniref:ion channel n=1 Tax=Alkanindiges illinoisensis TaxID=197183 RepID=UPI00047AECD0|nr:ion channel [Alkanindiges illinoisensis]
MHSLLIHWKGLKLLPSAWLLFLQLFIFILSPLTTKTMNSNALSWCLSALALLLIAAIIRRSPIYTVVGLILVIAALILSGIILFGGGTPHIQVAANVIEAAAYIYGASGLLMYMFADKYVTRDELFAAATVFTLFAWAFAFLYSACQTLFPASFVAFHGQASRTWLELLFLSFSVQSGTGLSDIIPVSSAARVLVSLQMFVGVMYLTLVVSRVVTLQYIKHAPKRD